ncbi:MAG: hypothetical protein GH152_01060 [Dehalococcoidia bacterium]|nr:hypothetical protein [Dehalococcoidia bacterium]
MANDGPIAEITDALSQVLSRLSVIPICLPVLSALGRNMIVRKKTTATAISLTIQNPNLLALLNIH